MSVQFAEKYFSLGAVYYDKQWAAFKALGKHGQVRRLGLLRGVWLGKLKLSKLTPLGKRLTKRGIINQEAGDESDGFVQGGVVVMGPGQTGVHYIYLEKTGQKLPVAEIRNALLALPRPVTWP